ncbi:DinB family protein [Aliisedimentitalea scapharcae]|uniref:DinB family protein n=1 Tax=Aliisedimentitalea scapharcae TaxID=1524259 RepID=A0ABZ2XR62_9RHOB
MISTEYCRLLARYNTWQNASLVTAATGLTDAERWLDRGAVFKSIAATLNHLYWADALMLERIQGNERPQDTLTHSLTSPSDWFAFKDLRAHRDAEIEHWADSMTDTDLTGIVRWDPPDGSARIEQPKSICVVQLFNHQTHHRGQIHAMLTAAGAAPDPTDIPAMPQHMLPGANR